MDICKRDDYEKNNGTSSSGNKCPEENIPQILLQKAHSLL
jgi:hypothetical protein